MHENEFVYVYFGPLEIPAEARPGRGCRRRAWSFDDISRRIERDPDAFTFWFKHYFQNHGAEISRLAKTTAHSPPG